MSRLNITVSWQIKFLELQCNVHLHPAPPHLMDMSQTHLKLVLMYEQKTRERQVAGGTAPYIRMGSTGSAAHGAPWNYNSPQGMSRMVLGSWARLILLRASLGPRS